MRLLLCALLAVAVVDVTPGVEPAAEAKTRKKKKNVAKIAELAGTWSGSVTTKQYGTIDGTIVVAADGSVSFTVTAATSAGETVQCATTVLKTLKGVSLSSSGNTLVFGDGSTLAASAATVITDDL